MTNREITNVEGFVLLSIFIIMIALVLSCTGCAYTTFKDSRVNVSRIAFGLDYKASKIYANSGEKTTTIRVGELGGDGGQSVEAIIDAASMVSK